MKKNLGIWITIGVLLILFMYGCSTYNGLVKRDEDVKSKWGNVQNDYQRRTDLIPNLVNTVKGAANFEKSTLTEVTEARAKATSMNISANDLSPEKIKQFQQAQGQVSAALGKLLAISENYPQLRATEAFRDLQAQIEGTENRIKVSRNDFNDAVKSFNSKVRRFPTNIIAKVADFDVKGYFEASPGSEKAPEVKF